MRIIADSILLVRAAISDDPGRSAVALETMRAAETNGISLVAFCEFAQVLTISYKKSKRMWLMPSVC